MKIAPLMHLAFLLLAPAAAFAQDAPAEEDPQAWIARLASPDTRDTARDKLRDLGPTAVPLLMKALKEAEPVIRSEAAFVLGRIGRKEAVAPLIEALSDADARVRTNAAYALGELSDPKSMAPLIKALSDADALVRANACFALGHVGDPKAAPDLVKALADPDENVRNFAASALGTTKETKALPALAWVALKDTSSGARALAAASMGTLGDKHACDTLVGLLDDKEYVVRARAIEALVALVNDRRGYEARETEPQRAAAVGRWKAWLAKQKLAPVKPREPTDVYETWGGKSKPPKPVEPGPDTPDAQLVPPGRLKIAPVSAKRPREAAKAVADNPAASAFFAAGRKDFDAADFEGSARAFEACLQIAPTSCEAAFNRALALRRLGKNQAAIDALRQALKINPKDAESANEWGTILAPEETTDVEALYREAVAWSRDYAPARFNLAEVLLRGEVVEPMRLYQSLDDLATPIEGIRRAVVKLRLGTCLRRMKDTDRAKVLLNDAAAGATDPAFLREVARQLAAMREFAQAKALLIHAYELSAGDAETAWALAMFLMRVPDDAVKDAKRAAVYAEVAWTAKPAEERFVSAMAEAKWALGEKEKAVSALEESLKKTESATLRKQLEEYRKSLVAPAEKAEVGTGEDPAGAAEKSEVPR